MGHALYVQIFEIEWAQNGGNWHFLIRTVIMVTWFELQYKAVAGFYEAVFSSGLQAIVSIG